MMEHKPNVVRYLVYVLFLAGIAAITYVFQRYQTQYIVPIYLSSFLLFWWMYSQENFSFKELILLGIIARVMLIPAVPNLSDDVYRFIWDGRLLAAGINPFSHVPSYYMENTGNSIPGLTSELYGLLNSDNHTIYPPVVQFIFWLAAIFFPDSIYGSIIFIRVFHLLADVGVFYFSIKLLKHFNLPQRNVLLFFINPLVILELTGNMHAEGLMLFFTLGGIHFFNKNRVIASAILWALAVATKLLPLIFLPYLLLITPWKKNILFFTAFGVSSLLLFLPLLSVDFITGMQSSISLYFQRFEFNASIYYIVREIGYWMKGYNIIASAGKALAVGSFISIITLSVLAWKKKWGILSTFSVLLFSYFLFTNILHPWYVVGLLGFTIFTTMRFAILWTALIFLTYVGYTATGFQENLWIVSLEYILVISWFVYDISFKKTLIHKKSI